MKRMKRWVCLMLVMAFVATLLPMPTKAATPKNDAEIEARINELVTMFAGKHFTVNQKPCNAKRESGHGCSNCNTTEIVKAKWFKDLFGTVSASQFYSTGKSCNGFAWFAEWYIFRDSNKDTINRKVIKDGATFNYDTISKYAKVGDFITAKRSGGSHAFVLIGYDQDGIKVLDSNWSGKQCMVRVHRMNFENSKYTTCKISRCYSTTAGKAPTAEEKNPSQGTASTLSFSLPSGSYPTGTLQPGKSFVLKGTIKSNYAITYVKGEILDSTGEAIQTKEIKNGKAKSVSIQSSILNKQLKFGTLPAGSYTLKYTAKDSSGNTIDVSKSFTVAGKNSSTTPATATKYTITLNAQGGTVSKKSIQVEEGKSYGNLPVPSKNGYEFSGWFLHPAGVGRALTAGTVILPENHTIYATWEKVSSEPESEPETKPESKPDCNGNHVKGTFVRTEAEHPHADVYQCKVCGTQFATESTKCVSTCKICNPGKQLRKAPAAKVLMNTGETLKNGSSGDNVRRLQMNLNTLGFDAGSADGKYGNGTKKAVTAFQKDQKLEADGIAGKKTLSRIVDIAVEVQTQLYQLGHYDGKIDGVMGSDTQKALKAFQKENGYTQSGLATTAVRSALKKAVS